MCCVVLCVAPFSRAVSRSELRGLTHGGALHRGTGYIEILDQLQRHVLPPPEPRDFLTACELVFPQRDAARAERAAASGGKSRDAVIDYVQEHVMASSRELAAAGMSVGGIRRVLNEMVEAGERVRTEPVRSPKQRYRFA